MTSKFITGCHHFPSCLWLRKTSAAPDGQSTPAVPSNTVIWRGFMPQVVSVSCYLCETVTCLQGVWSRSCFELASLRPATVFAWLPHSELMQLSNTPPEKHARSAASQLLSLHSISRACLQSYLSPGVQTPTHDGGSHKKINSFSSLLPPLHFASRKIWQP